MKQLLSIVAVLAILATACIMGVGTVAFAAEESSPDDFLVYDGILEEYIGDGGDIVIPASLGIVEIAPAAFTNNTDITSVVIPEGVEIIGKRAFQNDVNIESVTLPYSLTEIQESAFSTCTSLAQVTIPGNVETVGACAFSSCEFLTDLTLSYGVRYIQVLAFQGTSIQKVIFPETVELICGAAFTHNKNASIGTIEYYICNPDCEVGSHASSGNKWEKFEWEREMTPWSHNKGDATYKIYVPEGSEVAKTLKANGETWLRENSSGAGDGFKLYEKETSFFNEYNEWTKEHGTQKPSATGTNTNTDGDNDEQNPTNGNGTSNKNNTPGNNTQGGATNTVVQQGSDNTALFIIIAVIGGVMLVAIIVVVILAATGKLFGNKKASEPAQPEDEETAALKAEIEQIEKAKEKEALKAKLASLKGEETSAQNEQTEDITHNDK